VDARPWRRERSAARNHATSEHGKSSCPTVGTDCWGPSHFSFREATCRSSKALHCSRIDGSHSRGFKLGEPAEGGFWRDLTRSPGPSRLRLAGQATHLLNPGVIIDARSDRSQR
jgi:hypothetical protein